MTVVVEHRALPPRPERRRRPHIAISRVYDEMTERDREGGGINTVDQMTLTGRKLLDERGIMIIPMASKKLTEMDRMVLDALALKLGYKVEQ